MKFYIFKHSLSIPDVGVFPQVQDFKSGYDNRRPESCSRISRYESEVPLLNFDFDGMQLKSKAKLTDYLTASYMSDLSGLLVSGYLCSYIKSKRIVENIIYPVGLYSNNEKLSNEYYWIHYTKTYPEIINYKQSKFFLNHNEAKYKEIIIESNEDFVMKQEGSEYIIDSRYLVLKKEITEQFDFLRIGVVKNATYVTEAVRDEMIAKGFTGIVYEPADYLIVE